MQDEFPILCTITRPVWGSGTLWLPAQLAYSGCSVAGAAESSSICHKDVQ